MPSLAQFDGRIRCETRALDSYYNILFSILQFWRESFPSPLPSASEEQRVWPSRITIISHSFKKSRLVDEHCAAIGFPLERVSYIGIDPPGILDDEGTMRGNEKALKEWRDDPHGNGEGLAGKRDRRNPWGGEQDLFLCDEERLESGVVTRRLDEGKGREVLVDGAVQPWSMV